MFKIWLPAGRRGNGNVEVDSGLRAWACGRQPPDALVHVYFSSSWGGRGGVSGKRRSSSEGSVRGRVRDPRPVAGSEGVRHAGGVDDMRSAVTRSVGADVSSGCACVVRQADLSLCIPLPCRLSSVPVLPLPSLSPSSLPSPPPTSHYIKKYNRYEKRHKNVPAHCSPAFKLNLGDNIIVGQCRPLSKTVRFNVLSVVSEATSGKGFSKY